MNFKLLTSISLCVSALLFTAQLSLADNMSVTMNSVARTMKLFDSENHEVTLPEPSGSATKHIYELEAEPGVYTIEAFGVNDESLGTIQLNFPEDWPANMEEGFNKSLELVTVSAWLTNKKEDDSLWAFGTDYSIPADRIYAASREGKRRVLTPGSRTVSGNVQTTFQMLKGDTYTVYFVPSADLHPDFIENFKAQTVTATTANASTLLTEGLDYTISVPKGANLYVGKKGLTHYVAFMDIHPSGKKSEGDQDIYTYRLPKGKNTYIYRVSLPGENVMTHAGKFGYSDQYPKYSFSITRDEMMSHGTRDWVNHDSFDPVYKGGNLADILLNINYKGHKTMKSGESYQLIPLRVWQVIDDQSNNVFVDPDYHYTILDTNFKPTDGVVSIDDKGVMKAVGPGTAIVQVSYDALYAYEYNRVDAFGNFGKDQPYWFDAKWSKIWAENTGIFVVTVDGKENTSLSANMKISTDLEERKDYKLDSELDVLYYLQGEPGKFYTFKPEGCIGVSVANPNVNLEANTVSYAGFSTDNVTKNEDGSYTVLLTYGRNVIRVEGADGSAEYQVVSAKPFTYEVTNVSREGKTPMPGDKVNVQFSGLFHPTSKLAGIYNQSAYIYFNGSPNGQSLILSPNQYSFGGSKDAQLYQLIVPSDASGSYDLTKGALYVRGYGSIAGKHRLIDRIAGVNPNFRAPVTTEYWGNIPDVNIKLAEMTDGISFSNVPEGATIIVKDSEGHVIPDAGGYRYYIRPMDYSYEVMAHDYLLMAGNGTVAEGSGLTDIALQPIQIVQEDNAWDGTGLSYPYTVTAEEAADGEFKNKEGYYKIKNGYELAFVVRGINNKTIPDNSSMVFLRDVDLKDFAWTPINNMTGGEIDGNGFNIDNINIHAATKAAFIKDMRGGTIRDLSIHGKITSDAEYAAGFVANISANNSSQLPTLINCHNFADITGTSNTGGIIGYLYYYPKANEAEIPVVFTGCTNDGKIQGTARVGGIGGYMVMYNYYVPSLEISQIANHGDVTGTNEVGGLVGRMHAFNVHDSYNTGAVTASSENASCAGIVGHLSSQKAVSLNFANIYNAGNVNSGHPVYSSFDADRIIGVALTNVHSIASENTTEGVILLSDEKLTSGELAWILNNPASLLDTPTEGGNTENAVALDENETTEVTPLFGQNIGEDTHPVFHGSRVFKVDYTSNIQDVAGTIYTNGTLPSIIRDGKTSVWYSEKGGELVNTVDRDGDLYVDFTVESGVNNTFASGNTLVYDNRLERLRISVDAKCNLTIVNANGVIVVLTELNAGESSVDLSGLEDGVYIAKCKEQTLKLVK